MLKVAISQYPRNSLMGYSIRNERWRATFWRERSGSRIEAIELYDELNDPTETVSLHDRPEHKPLLETLVQSLPPVGSAAVVKKPKAEKPTAPSTEKKPAPENESREARYDRLYPGKAQLTLEEYLTKQSDNAASRERFTKFDANQDGVVTRAEFITSGAKPKP
jgi:hypothetical protein